MWVASNKPWTQDLQLIIRSDKSQAPTYYTKRIPDDNDTQMIVFTAGPPYEDIAFRIVRRPWQYSHRLGFRSMFDRGVLQCELNLEFDQTGRLLMLCSILQFRSRLLSKVVKLCKFRCWIFIWLNRAIASHLDVIVLSSLPIDEADTSASARFDVSCISAQWFLVHIRSGKPRSDVQKPKPNVVPN